MTRTERSSKIKRNYCSMFNAIRLGAVSEPVINCYSSIGDTVSILGNCATYFELLAKFNKKLAMYVQFS